MPSAVAHLDLRPMKDSPRNYRRAGVVSIIGAVFLALAAYCKHVVTNSDVSYFRGGYVPWWYALITSAYLAALGCFCFWRAHRIRANHPK